MKRMKATTLAVPLAASLLLTAGASAQFNATSKLMTYGDVLGGAGTARLSEVTPGVQAIILPSLVNGPNNALVNLTGDPNDELQVGLDQYNAGRFLAGISDASGVFEAPYALPNLPVLLDASIWWQGFTRPNPGAGNATEFDDFSNLRLLTGNNAGRWQAGDCPPPAASADLAWVVTRTGNQGRATELFVSGGGPALLTDSSVPYFALDDAWYCDAASGATTPVSPMNETRAFHTMTLLQDDRILVTGGVEYGGQNGAGEHFTVVKNSAEIYDPATDSWTPLPSMTGFRAGHTANLLPDGRVIVAGGTRGSGANHQIFDFLDLLSTELRTTEIFDPATDTFSAGPNMREPKAGHAGISLPNGDVLWMGGVTFETILGIDFPDFSNQVDRYTYVPGGSGSVAIQGSIGGARALFGATLLPDGRVACLGGVGGSVLNPGPVKQSSIYDPAGGPFNISLPDLPQAAGFGAAVVSPDPSGNKVWSVGGARGDLLDPLPIADVYEYDVSALTVTTLPNMNVTHGGGVVEVLEDGTLFVSGGESDSGTATTTTESYSP